MRKWTAGLFAVALCVCAAGFARANEQIGAAASDPSAIPAMVAKMAASDVPAFAGQVVAAISRMPLAPDRRVAQMAAAAEAFLGAVDAAQRAAVLAQVLAAVPPRMLPAWVAAMKAPVGTLTASLDDTAYAAFTADVLKAIDALPLDAESKIIDTTFALVLLCRAEKPEDVNAFVAAAVAVLPESYRDTVAAVVPPTLAGDYTAVFGPGAEQFRLVVPVTYADPTLEVGGLTTLATVDRSADETIFIDVGLERPSVRPVSVGTSQPTSSSPVIPPPYGGQF